MCVCVCVCVFVCVYMCVYNEYLYREACCLQLN